MTRPLQCYDPPLPIGTPWIRTRSDGPTGRLAAAGVAAPLPPLHRLGPRAPCMGRAAVQMRRRASLWLTRVGPEAHVYD